MATRAELLDLICCPFCGAKLEASSTIRGGASVEYGLLACRGCGFDFPIVAGIPILMAPHEAVDAKFETSELTMLPGPSVGEIAAALKQGDAERALALLLNPARPAGNWFFHLPHGNGKASDVLGEALSRGLSPGRGERARSIARRVATRYLLPRARGRLASYLDAHSGELTAFSAMDLYYRRYSKAENFNYFAYRLGQPRHLAALGLSSLLRDGRGPLLDLACGAGQLTHFLERARPGRAVIGVDREFFRLWVAARYTSPGALFVCASADRPLPFAGGCFDGVLCSDAFHYFLNRAGTVRELQRVLSPEGVLVLARFGNALVEPREGYELDPEGYAKLFDGMPHVFLGEHELLETYLAKRGPELRRDVARPHLAREKWLSVVASRRQDVFSAGRPLDSWPHAVGRLRVNPIYRVQREPNGDLELTFHFPSHWYEVENAAYASYAPARARVSRDAAVALERGEWVKELDDLVARCVLIGTPDRYL